MQNRQKDLWVGSAFLNGCMKNFEYFRDLCSREAESVREWGKVLVEPLVLDMCVLWCGLG